MKYCEKNNNQTKKSPPENDADIHDAANALRLNQAIAKTGYCSRRKADELIFAGRVLVNDALETNPARKVLKPDQLKIDGVPLNRSVKPVYIMLNKPIQTVVTMRDPQGRKTVMDLLPQDIKKLRPFPVGRLDYFSEGLLILTNDGDLAQMLAHPSKGKFKIYNVLVRGDASSEKIEKMSSGMTLRDGARLAPVKIRKIKKGENTLLVMSLRQGINRQIRKMCDELDLVILKLARIRQGDLELGDLESGHWRHLTAAEIDRLKNGR